ncbi:tRNA (adenosine(37)-N6)-threonylcarbamoyltransferase complex ATPase subunit type 1 TsaE [Flagellimonas halotolerans]|uniref:tRNA threonylcarbamoyladenosine biosynthesis protein TsaE n=1 Tax=Flagellimonas halotolerans TaxID=3112164 RepID=A0ABU6IN92_9FLAO|nr:MULTISPECIES: tRNA (adenosine(37)-N6)-threonylcarbamoyltransferase complex ATPase subunit type 1 TsaE [unclassified Allomuricauda]MEC3964635.1 tRNA (adenosine(37)-N6)-threonylcarbamoyltransferase complex ATPase subunit type 1 TsaE [Muricauda sp. SYSU M86414]MEC4264504.1 tRNA (adenosine(37)-N6)-threonylcarbamoyltransferase complex ATPase subunit type 1 TsaE [Muricauda sp. SYSU M84420]
MKRNFELSEIREVAKELLEKAPNKVLCLYGDMGVGKTTLVKALVKELGAVDVASSPTFGLVNEYHDNKDTLIAYHFDFYRLNDEMEALDMGLEDYLNSGVWLFIEWPNKISSLLPEDAVGVFLHFVEESTRSIELNIS